MKKKNIKMANCNQESEYYCKSYCRKGGKVPPTHDNILCKYKYNTTGGA